MEDGHHDYTAADAGHLPPPSVPQPQQPELHRSGKRTLMLLGSTATTQIWRDVTEMVRFANSKYQPHQGKQECARRLRQADEEPLVLAPMVRTRLSPYCPQKRGLDKFTHSCNEPPQS